MAKRAAKVCWELRKRAPEMKKAYSDAMPRLTSARELDALVRKQDRIACGPPAGAEIGPVALAGSTGAHGYRRGCRVVRSSVVLVGRSGDGLDGGPIASFDAGNPRTRGCGPWALLRADPLVVSGFRGIGISARAPSALAVGIGDGSVGSAGADVRGTRLGVIVGVTFMVLPRVTWAATEARSYAMVLALSTVTMLVLVCSLRTSKRACWILYGVLAAVSVALFLYSAVLLLVHAVIVVFGAKVIPDADSKRNSFQRGCALSVLPRPRSCLCPR